MSKHSDLLDTPAFISDLQGDTVARVVAERWAVSTTFVKDHRRNLKAKDGKPAAVKVADAKAEALSFEQNGDEGRLSTGTLAEPLDDLSNDDILRQFGRDPAKHKIVGTLGERHWWMNERWNHWYAFKTERVTAEERDEFESVLERIRNFTYVPAPTATNPESLIIMPTDLQVGKVDWNGGTDATVAQAMESFAKAAEFAREFRPTEICIVDAGDPIENIYNTSAQLGTNDRDLPAQLEVAHNIFLSGVEMLAPYAPSIRYAAVSSNHGAQRLGPKSPAGDAHADYGLGIAKMIRRALQLNPGAFGHVTVQTPEPYMESLYFQTSGSDIGVVHGHQASGADRIGEWWKGQSHGNMPVAKARILLAGHWHSLRYFQSGDGRHVFVGPASDRGSSWFTNLRGESSESGMLSFTTSNNNWDNLRVL